MKELKEDPGKFAGGEVGGLFLGMFIVPMALIVLFQGLLFVLGFTDLLWGPFGFFKFLFFLFIFPSIIFFSILFKAYKVIKGTTKKAVNNTIKVESKIVE